MATFSRGTLGLAVVGGGAVVPCEVGLAVEGVATRDMMPSSLERTVEPAPHTRAGRTQTSASYPGIAPHRPAVRKQFSPGRLISSGAWEECLRRTPGVGNMSGEGRD